MTKKIIHFLQNDIWLMRLKTLPRLKAIAILHLRVIVLSIKGFLQDKCTLRASALTFFSLLSIVPVLAMSFGIAKGFGMESMLESQILEKLASQPEVAEKLITFSKNALSNTQGGLVAGIGIILLFWSVMKVLGHVENSFNEIWGIKKSRPMLEKIERYLLVSLSPLLLILSSSANVYITSQITNISKNIEFLSNISTPMFFLLKFTPYLLLWLAFSLAYILMPYTKVKISNAFMGGIIAGTAFQIMQKAYIHFQFGVAKYSAIYGSLAALPLFLIWLQISWLIVLFGAEIAFALQNHEQFEYEMEAHEVSFQTKELLALRLTLACVENFCKEKTPWSAEEFSDILNIPIRVTRDVLFQLTECAILSRVCNNNTDRFQPGIDPDLITITSVLEKFRAYGKKSIDSLNDSQTQALTKTLKDFTSLLQNSQENRPLKTMIE